MTAFQDRVVIERDELQGKIHKLRAFINDNKIFSTLPPDEQLRLRFQLMAMEQYNFVLCERIMAF